MQHDIVNLQTLLDGYRQGRADQATHWKRIMRDADCHQEKIDELTNFATFFHFQLTTELERHAGAMDAHGEATGRDGMVKRHLGSLLRNTRDRINPDGKWALIRRAVEGWRRHSREGTRADMSHALSLSAEEGTRAQSRQEGLQGALKGLGLSTLQRWIRTSQDLLHERLMRLVQAWPLESSTYHIWTATTLDSTPYYHIWTYNPRFYSLLPYMDGDDPRFYSLLPYMDGDDPRFYFLVCRFGLSGATSRTSCSGRWPVM